MSGKFTKKAENVLNKTLDIACELGHSYIGGEHLLLAMLAEEDCTAAKLLIARGLTYQNVREEVIKRFGNEKASVLTPADMSSPVRHIIEQSAFHSKNFGKTQIGTEHMLIALAEENITGVNSLLVSLGTDFEEIKEDTFSLLTEITDFIGSSGRGSRYSQNVIKDAPMLLQHGRDLNRLAAEGKLDELIGRENELNRVMEILSRRSKNNPCLIGEAGVGKTAIAEGLARLITSGRVPEELSDRHIIMLDISSMVAGAKYRGEFEDRMKAVLREVGKNKSVILFIDEIHTLIGAGAAEGAIDAANILKPALARGELQVIGATTISEYRKHIEKDPALARRFQPVVVKEPDEAQAIKILEGLRPAYEAHHRLKIEDEAIVAAVRMSVRYINDRFLPDKAIDLIDEAASRKRIQTLTMPEELARLENEVKKAETEKESAIRNQDFEKAAPLRDYERRLKKEFETKKSQWQAEAGNKKLNVTPEDIAELTSLQTGIPANRINGDEEAKLRSLERELNLKVIGQPSAVSAVAKAIRRNRTGLRNPARPIGSFIFSGTTGVGKTELAKVLAQVMFGSRESMIRFDMSEYSEKQATSKLIGSPPGYVGYDEGGLLTEAVRRKPYSLVVFDEIEKAHRDIFNILLQVLDDGILTDSQGNKVNFKNTIIIMTTNAGCGFLQSGRKGIGFANENYENAENRTKEVKKQLELVFPPEFLNRIDEIVVFNSLTKADIRRIAQLLIDELKNRALMLGLKTEFEEGVFDYITEKGFNDAYGARELRRVIQTEIEDVLANELLSDNKCKADGTVLFSVENGRIKCKSKE